MHRPKLGLFAKASPAIEGRGRQTPSVASVAVTAVEVTTAAVTFCSPTASGLCQGTQACPPGTDWQVRFGGQLGSFEQSCAQMLKLAPITSVKVRSDAVGQG